MKRDYAIASAKKSSSKQFRKQLTIDNWQLTTDKQFSQPHKYNALNTDSMFGRAIASGGI
ncbi:hypothetical protein FJR38_25265 [Anabaena sp. UHCC 0253]|nr:hypothetical protein [Anabaena sp. UHCC 0253]